MKRHSAKEQSVRQRRVSLRYAGGDMILIYRLTEETAPCRRQRIYSLSVTQISQRGENRESVFLYDVSRKRNEADYIFDMISRGAVTPLTAAEIVSDLIGIPR